MPLSALSFFQKSFFPQDLSTIRSQPFAMFRFPTPGLSKLPDPRTSAVDFHYLQRNSIRENFNFAMIDFTKFFPKQFHRKFFPGLSQKIYPAHATITRFAIFQKCRIASFARMPASNSRPAYPVPAKRGVPPLVLFEKIENYLPGYGWIPSDVTVAEDAEWSYNATDGERQHYKQYYSENLDPYRYIIQKDADLPLVPDPGDLTMSDMFFLVTQGQVRYMYG